MEISKPVPEIYRTNCYCKDTLNGLIVQEKLNKEQITYLNQQVFELKQKLDSLSTNENNNYLVLIRPGEVYSCLFNLYDYIKIYKPFGFLHITWNNNKSFLKIDIGDTNMKIEYNSNNWEVSSKDVINKFLLVTRIDRNGVEKIDILLNNDLQKILDSDLPKKVKITSNMAVQLFNF